MEFHRAYGKVLAPCTLRKYRVTAAARIWQLRWSVLAPSNAVFFAW